MVASPMRYPSVEKSGSYPFSRTGTLHPQSPDKGLGGLPTVTALSIEFVAKPQEARRAESAIPLAIANALKDVTGFAGCLVMISDQEARLLTVVTLWAGDERGKRCNENIRWVKALLAPYLDRCLRVQTMIARLPMMLMNPLETTDAGKCTTGPDVPTAHETVCLA
jgi:hypothetical protein